MAYPRQQRMYDLLWIVDGVTKEVPMVNKSLALCKWKASQLKNSTHRIGLLQPRPVDQRPKGGWR